MYFMDHEGRGYKKFGRIDLDTMSFESLPEIPGKFAFNFHGCYHHDRVFVVADDGELYAYDVKGNSWNRCGVKVPFCEGKVYAHLLSDPQDDSQHLYVLGRRSVEDNGLYRIDLSTKTVNLVSKPPVPYARPQGSLLLRMDSTGFIIVTVLEGGLWYKYSSVTNSWTALSRWMKSNIGNCESSYIVYAPDSKTFFYRVHGCDKWVIAKL